MNNADRIIAPGMSARVRIRIKQTGDALLLPRDAVIKKPDGSESVWVIRDNGKGLEAKSISLQTGQAARENLAIISGEIRPGDRVVVRGNEILRPGQAVYIAEELEMEL